MRVLRVAVTTSIGEGYAVGPEAFQECVVLYILEMPLKYSHLKSFFFVVVSSAKEQLLLSVSFPSLLPYPAQAALPSEKLEKGFGGAKEGKRREGKS